MHRLTLSPKVGIAVAMLTALLSVGARPAQAQDGKDSRYNRETVAIMRRVMAKNANGVDVGAFKGALTKPMLAIAPLGSHIAVEPQPAYASQLRKRFPGVRVVEGALGERQDTATFIWGIPSTPGCPGTSRPL